MDLGKQLENLGKKLGSLLIVLIIITSGVFIAAVVLGLRENDGIKALAQIEAQEAVIAAQRELIAMQNTNIIDLNARVRKLQTQFDWLRKALWQQSFPGVNTEVLNLLMSVDAETLNQLQELINERAVESPAEP